MLDINMEPMRFEVRHGALNLHEDDKKRWIALDTITYIDINDDVVTIVYGAIRLRCKTDKAKDLFSTLKTWSK